MSKYQDTVRATYQQLETEQIQERLRSGTLTEEARLIAEAEILSRGEQPTVPEPPPEQVPLTEKDRPSESNVWWLCLSGIFFVLLGIFSALSTLIQVGFVVRGGAGEPLRHVLSFVLCAFLTYVSFKVLAGIAARLRRI